MNIFISVGHHLSKQGASFEGITEYSLAGRWAFEIVRQINIMQGKYRAQLVRGTLAEKVADINIGNPILAVEVHFNSAKNAEGKHIGSGCETLFFPGSIRGQLLAVNIQNSLAKVIGKDRGVKPGWYRMNPDNGPDYFLSHTSCPSVIVEPEFIHKLAKIEDHRDEACKAIAIAVVVTATDLAKD